LLGLPIEAFDAAFLLSNDLNIAYTTTLANFNANDNLEIIEKNNGKKRIKLSKLEKVEDPKSLISLRDQISNLLPKI